MSPGYQLAQSTHAAIQFAQEHSEIHQEWFKQSNYLCMLAANNEAELIQLIDKAIAQNIKFSIFREPDIDDQITAIALEPSIKSKKICSNLRLALKE